MLEVLGGSAQDQQGKQLTLGGSELLPFQGLEEQNRRINLISFEIHEPIRLSTHRTVAPRQNSDGALRQTLRPNFGHLLGARRDLTETACSVLPIHPNGERSAQAVRDSRGDFLISRFGVNTSGIVRSRASDLGVRPYGAAKKHGVITSFEVLAVATPNLTEVVNICLPYLDFFIPNYEEAVMMCGLRGRQEILRYFLDRSAKHTVLRMGANGSTIGTLEGEVLREIRTPAFDVPIVDSTGCRDAYNAGFIKGLSLGWDLENCAWLGCARGGLVIQGLGSDAGIESFEGTVEFAKKTRRRPITD